MGLTIPLSQSQLAQLQGNKTRIRETRLPWQLAQKLLESSLWKTGPTWISNSSEWPQHSWALSIYRTHTKYPMNKGDFTNFVFKIRDEEGNYYNDYNWRKCVLRYAAFLRFQKMAKKRYFPKCYDLRPRILIKPVFDPNNSYFKKPIGRASIKIMSSNVLNLCSFVICNDFMQLKHLIISVIIHKIQWKVWGGQPIMMPPHNLILSVGRQHNMLRKK